MDFAPCSHCCRNTQTNKQTGDSETLFCFCTTWLHCLVNVINLQLVSRSEKLFSESYRFAENNASIVTACISTHVNDFVATSNRFFNNRQTKSNLTSVVLRLARLCTWKSVRKEIISLAVDITSRTLPAPVHRV